MRVCGWGGGGHVPDLSDETNEPVEREVDADRGGGVGQRGKAVEWMRFWIFRKFRQGIFWFRSSVCVEAKRRFGGMRCLLGRLVLYGGL